MQKPENRIELWFSLGHISLLLRNVMTWILLQMFLTLRTRIKTKLIGANRAFWIKKRCKSRLLADIKTSKRMMAKKVRLTWKRRFGKQFHNINIECRLSAHAANLPSIFTNLLHIKEKHFVKVLGVYAHSSALQGFLVVLLKWPRWMIVFIKCKMSSPVQCFKILIFLLMLMNVIISSCCWKPWTHSTLMAKKIPRSFQVDSLRRNSVPLMRCTTSMGNHRGISCIFIVLVACLLQGSCVFQMILLVCFLKCLVLF